MRQCCGRKKNSLFLVFRESFSVLNLLTASNKSNGYLSFITVVSISLIFQKKAPTLSTLGCLEQLNKDSVRYGSKRCLLQAYYIK